MSDLERRAEEHLRQLSNHIGASQDKCKYELDSAQVIEQLLSENRQIRAGTDVGASTRKDEGHVEAPAGAQSDENTTELAHPAESRRAEEELVRFLRDVGDRKTPLNATETGCVLAADLIASLRQDLDRISAEREAMKDALGLLVYDKDGVPEEWPSQEYVRRMTDEKEPNR